MSKQDQFNPFEEIEAAKAVQAKRSFKCFVEQAWPIISPSIPYQPGYHHDAIIEHLQAVKDGHLSRLIINCPPRFGKSSLVSVLYHCWVWLTLNSANFLCTSFKSALTEDFSIKSQHVVYSDWYQKHFGHIVQFNKSTRKTIEAYDNAAKGERRAGVYATSTGFGPSGIGSALIIDDPHSIDGLSDDVRRHDLEIFDTGLSTRVQHGAAIVLACQRLHANDLSQHLLDRGGYQHLCLPNEYEANRKCFTIIGYEDPRTDEGELLWPDVCTPAVTEEKKLTLGSFAYAGQFQQSPVSKEGGLLNPKWFQTYTPTSLPEKFDEMVISWDFSFKGTAKSDWNVGQVWGRKNAQYFLLDQVRKQMEFVDTLRAVKALCDRWPDVRTILVEEAANGAAIISQLKDKIPGIIPVKPKDSKEARVSAVSPWIESGNVFIPEVCIWKDAFLYECSMFPKGRNDDQVDSMTQALLRFDKTRHKGSWGLIQHSVI